MNDAVMEIEKMDMLPPAGNEECLLAIPADIGDAGVAWLSSLRQSGWDAFGKLPMPARSDEAWRFSNLKAIDLTPYAAPAVASAQTADRLIGRSETGAGCGGCLVFGNGRHLGGAGLSAPLAAKGVVFAPLEEALATHGELIRKHLMAQGAHLGSDKFAALHQANLRSATFLYVPKGVVVGEPLEVFHWLTGGNAAAFPHTLLIAEPFSEVTLLDHFRSADAAAGGFACAVNDLYAGEGSKVTYICSQDWGQNVLALQMNSTLAEKDASVVGLNLNLGARYSRVESRSRMAGPGSRSDMLAVTVADQDQVFDLRTAQNHSARCTKSDLLYKNALAGSSKVVFSGIIRVEPGAHQTDAYQTNRSLMLSDEAESDSMPGLEILADDVKCSHGSTAGAVSEEEMFYFLSRGIPPDIAKQLMVLGFLDEVLDRLPDKQLVPALHARIEQKFDRMVRCGI